ncbi:isochorismatase family cysteine hydrolase [Ruminococcus sp.]
MKKALLVVDMQNVCVGNEHAKYFKYDNSKIINAVNRAIDDNKNSLVIYIKNIMKNNFINKFAPFQAYEGTNEVELVNGLKIVSENIIKKYKANAFSNIELNTLLKKNNIECIEIVGVDGGGCVALTAIGAMNAGYKVMINETAIGTMFEKNKNKYFAKLKLAGAEFI